MTKIGISQPRQQRTDRNEQPLIPLKFQHLAACFIIYLSLLIFFHAIIFDGKTYLSSDSLASSSWDTLKSDADAAGIFPLWNPYIFCGMPGYASLTFAGSRTYDITMFLWGKIITVLQYLFLGLQANWLLVYYLVYGIGMYFLAYHHLKNKAIALMVALMAVYATYFILLIMIGHFTKVSVIAFFPFVFLLVEKLQEKFSLYLALFLIVAVRFMLDPTHVQFIFYIYLSFGIYFIFYLIRSLLKKEPCKNILASGVMLLAATLIAVMMGADKYISPYEYNQYSIRGTNPIMTKSVDQPTKIVEGGLDYEYATGWSFSPGEMITFFIPSWYGFGPQHYQGPLTQNQEMRLYFYWGPIASVDGPQYMGIIVITLALVGLYKGRKNPFVQFMGVVICFSMLVSFGKEFPLIYDLMFRYFPMFNKFRVPSMILMLVQFFTPILAGYGIFSLIQERKNKMDIGTEKRWKYVLGSLAVGIFIAIVGSSVIRGLYSAFVSVQDVGRGLARSYGQLNLTVLGMMFDFIVGNVVTDVLIGCALLFIVFGSIYSFQKGKIASNTLYAILLFAIIFDLWRVAGKTSDPKDRQVITQTLSTPKYVHFLHQDTSLYRVIELENGQPKYNNLLAYWRIQNAYGYQGAKLRAYQDMVDVAGLGNPLVWQLMNVKYILTNREENHPALTPVFNSSEIKVYAFRASLPRVFFVNRYEMSNRLNTLNKIASMSFDPRDVAYLTDTLKTIIEAPTVGAEATMTHYGIQDLEVKVTATGTNLLFLSEAYYPKGWNAYIDGKETEILRLDYLFRGVVIPQGAHTLTMKFEPVSFTLGKQISLASNVLVWVGLFVIGLQFVARKKSLKITSQST